MKANKKSYKNNLLNSKGNITLFGLLIFLMLSTLTISLIKYRIETLKKIQDRARTYLCFKSEIRNVTKYISQIAYSNYGILGLNAGLFFPQTFQAAYDGIQMLKRLQILFFISYMKNSMTNKYCKFSTTSLFAINPIYSTKRNLLGLLETRKEQYSLYVKGNLKWKILLKATLKLSGNLSVSPTISTKEMFQFLDFLP